MLARSVALLLTASFTASAAPQFAAPSEAWVNTPTPSGIHVERTDVDGPVFADARGKTLYVWPMQSLRGGTSGEGKGKPACYGKTLTETAGLMSPYPAGIALPDLATRPTCTDLWEPLHPAAGAKPIGRWTLLERTDHTRQWAYDEQPVYTSNKDHGPGDVNGARIQRFPDRESLGGTPAYREPIGPPSALAPGLQVESTPNGRLLVNDKVRSVYSYDKDTPTQSACDESCARDWPPVLAPQLARARGEWSILDRANGERQWVFRGRPLYTHASDTRLASEEGSDTPKWHNIFVQPLPPPPRGFTVQDTIAGTVLADSRGKTIYVYNCADDSRDQLSCDHPDDTQVYRLAICGGGDSAQCRQKWPYVPAEPDAQSGSHIWSVIFIDPNTGRRTRKDQPNALSVWGYRDRPVYTFSGDAGPGDVSGDGIGEWRGLRNGFRAMWLRLDLLGG
jgi:predicted lipoprotein with Yx(FWY)xxD motif